MKQTIYFAEVPQEYLNDGECFEFEGRYFYFQLEVDFSIGHVKLVDTVGRYFPIDFDNLEQAYMALESASNLADAVQDFAIVEVR
jgi:hypothetical protein